jgi:hypothetical protein
MLEVRVNRAHLEDSLICNQAFSNPWDFVRDLFTIRRFAAFIESRHV